jgi:hypothetical protein
MTEWQLMAVPINFALGDWRIARVRLSLLVRRSWTPDAAPAPPTGDSLAPPSHPLPKGCWGFLVRSMPLVSKQPRLRRVGDYYCYIREQFNRCYIDLSTTFEEYEAKFSGKSRSTMRRKIKKLAEENGGKVVWRKFTRPEELDEFYSLAAPISRQSYQHKLFDAGLPDDENFRQHGRELAAKDQVRAYLVMHKGQPSAYLYCPIHEGTLVYQYLGYLPDAATYSVGSILQWFALKDLFEEARFRLFDFTEGESDHKRYFATHTEYCGTVFFIKRSTFSAAIIHGQIWIDDASTAVGNWLERRGIKAKVKRLIRFGRGE